MRDVDNLLSEEQESVERNTPKRQICYNEIRLLGYTWDILRFDRESYKVLTYIDRNAHKMHSGNSGLGVGVELFLIRKDYFQTEWMKPRWTNNRLCLKKAANQKGSFFGTITLQIGTDGSSVRVVFDILHNVMVLLLQRSSFLESFVNGIFPPEPKIVSDNSTPESTLAIKDQPKVYSDKDDKVHDAMTSKVEHASRMVRVARQANISTILERTVLVSADVKQSVWVGPALE